MSHPLTTSRAARERRLIAASIWFGLLLIALVLWNTRSLGIEIHNPSEPMAFLLAAFATFVSLFAWMLFNPARGVSAETPILMVAGMATLFSPCVIAWCTMPPGSSLTGWLTFGLFVLLLIAVMSPVPEEFFGIPRDRHSYLESMWALEVPAEYVMDLQPDWLASTDFNAAVREDERPSLAPSAWQDEGAATSPRRRRSQKSRTDAETGSSRQLRPRFFDRWRQTTDAQTAEVASAPSRSDPVVTPVPVIKKPDAPGRQEKKNDEPRQSRSVRGEHRQTQRPAVQKRPDEHREETVTAPFEDPAVHRDSPPPIPLAGESTRDEIQVADAIRQTDFERVEDDAGGEMVEGTVTIHFDRSQKRANVHVPFTPPLRGTPDVESNAVDHEGIRIKVPERRPWGIRIEGRRTDTQYPEDVEVAFTAVHVAQPR